MWLGARLMEVRKADIDIHLSKMDNMLRAISHERECSAVRSSADIAFIQRFNKHLLIVISNKTL